MGVAALRHRRWNRAFWFGLVATVGGTVSFVLARILAFVAFARTVPVWYLPFEGYSETLANTISNLMAFAAAGLISVPVGIVAAVIGAAGRLKERQRTTEV